MGTKSIRIDEDLVSQAQRKAKMYHRSVNGQIEFWAKIGKVIESKISVDDAYSISQGIKELRVESPKNIVIDSNDIFNELESDRLNGYVNKPITSAPFYFEASIQRPGLLDKVFTATGERQTGKFQNGIFEVL